jgi:preprotein translocase subunit SecY
MWQRLINAFSDKEIRRKMLFSLAILLVFRIGCYIPIPGISYSTISSAVGDSNSLLSLMSLMSGGSLQYGTFFALGVLPFINSYIIMQLLTLVIPALDRLSKQGDDGRNKITMITRYIAILLAIIQGIGIVVTYHNSGILDTFMGEKTEWFTGMYVIIMLTAGACLVMWLSERITEYGITNGTSLIIFIGIVATFGQSLISAFKQVSENYTYLWNIFGYLIVIVLLFALIVFMDAGERRIKVNYAKQVKGNKMYGGQSTYIPVKITSGGVMPIIFASAFMMFPQIIVSFLDTTSGFYTFYYKYLYASGNWANGYWVGNVVYYLFMFIFVIFFSYFYSQIQFNPQDVARNLQQYGGTILGVRPGKATSDYLATINNRIVLFGALFLAFIAIIPALIFNAIGGEIGLTSAFSATGMLIVVSVALELDKQLETQYMAKHYKGFLK